MLAAAYVAVFLACAVARVTFGFELSWLESGMQAMTDRLSAHQSIYAEPSPSYVPFIYPPLYYVVAGEISRAFPSLGRFTPMRIVSLASTIAVAFTVLATLRSSGSLSLRQTLLLSAMSLAFYGRFEFWHDTSRVDSLFVCLLFAATALLIEGHGIGTAVAAGGLGGLAILAKQPAAPLLAVAAAVVVLSERRLARGALALLVATAATVSGLGALGELGNPWFYYYVLRVPTTHPIQLHTLARGALFVLISMPLFVLAAAAELRRPPPITASHPRACEPAPQRRLTGGCWAVVFIIWTFVIFVLRLKEGASLNFFLPLVPVGILACAPAIRRLGALAEPLLLAQFLILAYNPLAAIPTAADWRAGFELLSSLRGIPGDIFLPQFPAYLSMVGKRSVAHGVAVCDLAALRPDLMVTIRQQIEAGHYSAATPWPVDVGTGSAGEGCRPSGFVRASQLIEQVPRGGTFFTASHGSKLREIDVFTASGVSSDAPLGEWELGR